VLAAQGTALTQLDSLAALRRWCDCILELNRGAANGGCPIGSLASELGRSAVPRDLAIGVLCVVQGGLLLAKTSRSEGSLKVALDMAFDHVASHSRSLSGSSPSGVSTSAKKRRR
jgi:hypothetical protein